MLSNFRINVLKLLFQKLRRNAVSFLTYVLSY